MDWPVSDYPKRIDGVYVCRHKPYVHIVHRKVLCSICPRQLRPTDLTIDQTNRLLPYRSMFAVEIDGDRNKFCVTAL